MIDPQPPAAAAQKALEGLADIATPPAVSMTPQTWGWAALAVVAGVFVVVSLWRWRRRALANRYRREAIGVLSSLEPRALDPRTRPDAVVAVAELIKRTALAAHARGEVAPLSGAAWVAFVRDSGFPGSALAEALLDDVEYQAPSSRAAISDADARALLAATRTWIKGHRVPA